MSVEQHKATVRRFFADFNKQDLSTQPALISPEYSLDFPGGPGTAHGLAGLRQATEAFIQSFPDLQFTVESVIAEGDEAAATWTMSAHQQGNLGPLPGTGKAVVLTGTSFFTFRDGKIVHDRVRADMLGLLQQIGAMPAPAPAGL
ncbi:MAG TPA: ester cyclase [Chloroflexia bacterium]|nr:ester cyclase [Chloroflexia bacterium]